MSGRTGTGGTDGIRFGTDGWRGVIGDSFTFANVMRVSRATAHALARHARQEGRASRLVLVAHDGRFLAREFAQTAAAVLASSGFEARLSRGPVPTPACSLWLRQRGALAAVVLTASHNPPAFGGFKIKLYPGAPAGRRFTDRVEAALPSSGKDAFEKKALKIPAVDVMPLYLAALRKLVNMPLIRRAGLRVAVDSMHGMGGTILEDLLRGGRSRARTIRAEARADFGGGVPEPKAENLAALRSFMRRERFSLGVALDGDADRLALLDETGAFVSPQSIMVLLADYLLTERKMEGHLAKNFAGTDMLEDAAAAHGRRCRTYPVGFKHISRGMLEEGVGMGGEEAGGIGMASHMPERDAAAVALLVMEAMASRRMGLRALVRSVERRHGGAIHYRRMDIAVPMDAGDGLRRMLERREPGRLGAMRVAAAERLDGLKLRFGHRHWILFRPSGTEPLLRVYAEAPSARALAETLRAGRGWIDGLLANHPR